MGNRHNRLTKIACIASAMLVVLFVLSGLSGCGDDKVTPPSPPPTEVTTAGASWSTWVLQQLASGIIKYTTGQSIGWVLSAFGSGGDSQDVTDALSYMEGQLNQIITDLEKIKQELKAISALIQVDTDRILSEIQQSEMSAAMNSINNQFENVQLFAKNGIPGSTAAESYASQFAEDFLSDGDDDMDQNVYDIYAIVMNVNQDPNGGALQALTNVLVDKAGDGQLLNRYKTLESYFNSLLEVQMKGAVLMVEALHHRDDPFSGQAAQGSSIGTWPGTAQEWYEQKYEKQIAEEIEEFLRCVDRLVLAEADVRTEVARPDPVTFLPDDADTCFSRADFIAAQVCDSGGVGCPHLYGMVIRVAGEPNRVNNLVENQSFEQNGSVTYVAAEGDIKYPAVVPLGVDAKKIRMNPVERWIGFPDGWTHAYLQWDWGTHEFHGDRSGHIVFDWATDIAMAKFRYGWRPRFGNHILVKIVGNIDVTAPMNVGYYDDTMQLTTDTEKGHPYGHATLVIRRRPDIWYQYYQHSDDNDNGAWTVVKDSDTSSRPPWVRSRVTHTSTEDNGGVITVSTGIEFPIISGMDRQQRMSAVVTMKSHYYVDLVDEHFGKGDKLTYNFTDASGETHYWHAIEGNGHEYRTSDVHHYYDAGEDNSFHILSEIYSEMPSDYVNDDLGLRVWPDSLYLFF